MRLLGFSVLPAMSAGDRLIYAANAGNDLSDGLTPVTPKRSIAAAKALQRPGTGDRVCLKRGDFWVEAYGSFNGSGASPMRRLVVCAYGVGARPRLLTGRSSAFDLPSGQTRSNIAIIGIEASAHTAVGTTPAIAGVMVASTAADILIEDCYLTRYATGICIPGGSVRKARIAVRRCTLYRNFQVGEVADGHGFYAANTDDLLLEENTFDQNGYDPSIAGSFAFVMRHDAYIQGNCTGVVSRGNIYARASSHGLQMRSGGKVRNDCFLGNPNGLLFGTTNEVLLAPIEVDASHFVILDSGTINGSGGNAALNLEAVSRGHARNFIIAKHGGLKGGLPLTMNGAAGLRSMRNMLVEDGIVHGWGGSVQINGDAAQLAGSAFRRMQIESPNSDFLVNYGSLAGAQAVAHEGGRWHRGVGDARWWYIRGGSPATCSLAQWQAQVGSQGDTTGAPS